MNWKFVSDSSSDLLESAANFENIDYASVPLKIIVDEEEFVDDEKLDLTAMFNAIKKSIKGTSSACPAPDEWKENFETADNVLAFTISSALSGSYNSAMVARDIVLAENPGKNIYVQDSHSTAGAMVLLMEKACELIQSAIPFDEIAKMLAEFESTLHTLVTLSNYENLVKNGRMSKFTGMIASSLGLRAIAEATKQGEIKVIHKTRGEQGAIKYIANLMGALKDVTDKHVIISHCNNENGANFLKTAIENLYNPRKISIVPTRGLTSFYADQEGLIVSY